MGLFLMFQRMRGGNIPLYLAVNNRNYELIRYLLSQPTIEVDLADTSGYTPLGIAVMNKDITSARMLLKAEADPNAVHDDGLPIQQINLTEDVRLKYFSFKFTLKFFSLK